MEKEKKPVYKKWWFWLIVIILLLGIIGSSDSFKEGMKDGINNNNILPTISNKTIIKETKQNEIELTNGISAEKDTTVKTNNDNKKTNDASNEEKQDNNISEKNNSNNEKENIQPTKIDNSTSDNNSEMVWVGKTGDKYHLKNCRTLKGNGHQITLKQAKEEGRQACKVCH